MEETRSFIPLLLVVFLAFLVPIVLSRFKKLRLPIVVGEILVGIIIGRSGFGWVQHHDPALDLLAEFGFVFLMFLSGMEIDFSNLRLHRSQTPQKKIERRQLSPLTIGGLSFGLTMLISGMVGYSLYRLGYVSDIWMMALILSTTSLGVVVPVLKERGLSTGRYGQTLLVAALIADFATMLLITVDVAVLSHGLTFDILLIGILFVAFFFMYRFGNVFFNQIPGVRRVLEELSHATAQIKVRAAFTMMLVFVVLAEVLGAEIILGAFLAGAIVSLLKRPEDEELSHQLESIGFGFFIPIFFIMVGVNFNLQALLESSEALMLVPFLVLAAFAVKILPALVFKLNFTWRETFGAGALLSARLSLIIAASAIGLRLGVISEAINADIILVAIITVTVAPLIFLRIIPETEADEVRPVIVVGAGLLGLQVAEQLVAHGEPVVLIDPDDERIQRARERGFDAVTGRAEQYDSVTEPYLDRAKSLVCIHADIERNFRVCERARTTYGIDHVVTRITDPGEIHRFDQLSVTTMNAAMDQAVLLGLLARNPAAYELLTRTDDDKEVCEVAVFNPQFLDKPLRQVDLPGDLLVLAVRREGELVVPHGDTRLSAGDQVTLLGGCDCVEVTREMLTAI
jgi:Kef-type K+ transport system membrane component KefB/Trk K+ transport system NAD-binding subunit